MNKISIILDVRQPRTKYEQDKDGVTYYVEKEPHLFDVFIDKRQSKKELGETIIHELLHVVITLLGKKLKNEEKTVEEITATVGRMLKHV